MANYNKVVLVGNLTRDPELQYLKSGTPVTTAGLAINRRTAAKEGQEARDEVTFVDLKFWSKKAELIAANVRKGDPLLVDGRLTMETWEAKDGGGKRSKLLVTVEEFQFLGKRRPVEEGGQEPVAAAAPANTPPAPAPADDLPF